MTFDKDQLRKTAELQKLMRDPAAVLALIAERDQLKADNEALRGLYQMHKQTETREMRDLKLENEALRKRIDDMSPFKGTPLIGPDLKCLACGGYHYGLSGLPCPKFRNTAQSDLPETRSGQIGAPMVKGERP